MIVRGLKKFLTTQFLSILYAFIMNTLIELIIRIWVSYMLIFLIPIITGVLCYFISRRYLDGSMINIFLVCLPFLIYSFVIIGVYGTVLPLKGDDNNYGLGIMMVFGAIGCFASVIIGMIAGSIPKWRMKRA